MNTAVGRVVDWIGRRPLWVGALGVGLPPFINLTAEGAPATTRLAAAAGLALVALIGFTVPVGRALDAAHATATARANTLVDVGDALRPVLERLHRDPAVDPLDARAETVSLVLGAATRLCGIGARTRACWFEFRGVDQDRQLVPVRYWGRGAAPRTTFRATEARGRELLAGLEAGRHELWPDLAAARPAQWQATSNNDHQFSALLVVPAITATGALAGMLTVDTSEPGALEMSDVQIARMLAGVLAVAYSLSATG